MPLLVFDLDGTLVDSQRDLADSANELLETLGAQPLDPLEVAGMVGDGARVLVSRILTAAGLGPRPSGLDEFLAIYKRRLAIHTRFYPSLLEMLHPLAHRAALAIVTNKPDSHTQALLEHFDVAGVFRWVIGGDSAFPRKPDPAGLLHVVDQWRRTEGSARAGGRSEWLSRVLYVGDSQIDLETGRNAGVRTCLAGYGFGRLRGDLSPETAEMVAERPEQLPDLLNRFIDAVLPLGNP
jgi:phosphoglycolate phosphatase